MLLVEQKKSIFRAFQMASLFSTVFEGPGREICLQYIILALQYTWVKPGGNGSCFPPLVNLLGFEMGHKENYL